MIKTKPPFTLKRALAYLERHPLVLMKARNDERLCKSIWWYAGHDDTTLWFQPDKPSKSWPADHIARAHTGLDMSINSEFEPGIDVGPKGFLYTRGTIQILIEYLDPTELK
jgi:hypothetical protein